MFRPNLVQKYNKPKFQKYILLTTSLSVTKAHLIITIICFCCPTILRTQPRIVLIWSYGLNFACQIYMPQPNKVYSHICFDLIVACQTTTRGAANPYHNTRHQTQRGQIRASTEDSQTDWSGHTRSSLRPRMLQTRRRGCAYNKLPTRLIQCITICICLVCWLVPTFETIAPTSHIKLIQLVVAE